MRTIKAIEEKYLAPAAEFVGKVFTESEGAESGDLVRRLVLEIRSKRFYLPELELIMVDEHDEIIGYCNFFRFHLEGRYENEPGCAIRAAIASGELDGARWESYRKLKEEAVDKDEMLRRKHEWSKGVAKFTRSRNKEVW